MKILLKLLFILICYLPFAESQGPLYSYEQLNRTIQYNDIKVAQLAIESSIKESPSSPEYHLLLAKVYYYQESYNLSQEELNNCLKLDKNFDKGPYKDDYMAINKPVIEYLNRDYFNLFKIGFTGGLIISLVIVLVYLSKKANFLKSEFNKEFNELKNKIEPNIKKVLK